MSTSGPGIQCPNCQGFSHLVIESRKAKQSIRRRRECEDCGYRFSTIESINAIPIKAQPQPLRADIVKRYIKEIREKCNYIDAVLSSQRS